MEHKELIEQLIKEALKSAVEGGLITNLTLSCEDYEPLRDYYNSYLVTDFKLNGEESK